MNKAEIALLRSRWTPERIAPLRAVLPPDDDPMKWPARPVTLADRDIPILRVGEQDYLDLRGYPIARAMNLNLSHADFSYAKSPDNRYGCDVLILLTGCDLTDCRFDHVQSFHRLDGRFTRCSFTHTRMRQAHFLATFDSCNFDAANLTSSSLHGARFVNCSFRGANFKHADVGSAVFDRCVLTGALFGRGGILGTRFLGCNLAGVDLADAFRNERTLFDQDCDLTGIRFQERVRLYGEDMDVGPPPVRRAANQPGAMS
jgi:uncharacterized protein YjbI with pentapeptide repeats